MMQPSFHYLTTPIYYVNDRPHLGHLYTSVAGDILARFYRLSGEHVKFVTGTDEHGAKVEQAARDKGVETLAYVDDMAGAFQQLIDTAHIQADDFVRTTQERHHKAATALWNRLEKSGAIYLGEYAGWYAVRDEAYYDASELMDTPEGKKAPTGAAVEWVQEACYFFRLSQWQQPLMDYYEEHQDAIGPESRRNEVLSFLKGGLRDLAVSRSKITWGIPIPGSSHVMYVWVDALTNYLTVLGYPDEESFCFQGYWPTCTHLMGKDILRFHAVYWPALLMAAGLQPPKRLFAHGWWMSEGQKMSKSLGNVMDPFALIGQYGADKVRYFLFRHVRFGQDGDFSKELFEQKCAHELADGLGNLAHRVLSFIQSRLDGLVPKWNPQQWQELSQQEHPQKHRESRFDCPGNMDILAQESPQYPQSSEQDFLHSVRCAPAQKSAKGMLHWGRTQYPMWRTWMDQQNIYAYLESIYSGIQKGNAYMAELAPWALLKLAKTGDPTAQYTMDQGLHALVSFLRDMAVALWPIMPDTAESLWKQVGMPGSIADHAVPGLGLIGPLDGTERGLGTVSEVVSQAKNLEKNVHHGLGLGELMSCSTPLPNPKALFAKEI
jgi:methionyl-tRNA synthetase